MRLYFYLYYEYHLPRKLEQRNLRGLKMGLEPQKFEISLGTKMNVEWVCFSSLRTKMKVECCFSI